MHAVIIGGTGFIGTAVCRELRDRGHRVTVAHRGRAAVPSGVEITIVDRDDAEALRQLARETEPDVVLHNICFTEEQARAFDVSFDSPELRRVVLSSGDVYAAFGKLLGIEACDVVPVPIAESSPLRTVRYPHRVLGRPNDAYDKILVEETVLPHPRTTVLRLPMVFGEGDAQKRLSQYAKPMATQEPELVIGSLAAKWQSCRVYVREAARAIVAVAESSSPPRRVYNVSHEHRHTELQWIKEIRSAMARAGRPWSGTVSIRPESELEDSQRLAPHPEQSILLDASALHSDFDLAPRESLEEQLDRTLEWELRSLGSD